MALQTKTITANGSKGHHRFTLIVNEDSTNIETNKSLGTYTFQISPIQTGWNWADWGSRISYSGSIGDTTFSGTIPRYDAQVTETLTSGSFEIKHNPDGNKTIAISFSVTDNTGVNYTCGNASDSGDMTLTYIPRKTNFTESDYWVNIGNVSKFATVKPASPTFTHSLKLTVGDTFTKYINGNTGEWSDTEIKFPTIFKEGTNEMDLYFDAKTDLYSLFTTSGTNSTLELTTYNGDNDLGISTANMTISVDFSKCTPTVKTSSVYDLRDRTYDLTGDHERMVAHESHCQLSLTLSPSAEEDTDTKIISLKINDVDYTTQGITSLETLIGTLSSDTIKVDLVNSRFIPNTVIIKINKWVPYVRVGQDYNENFYLSYFTRGSISTETTTPNVIQNVFVMFGSPFYNGYFDANNTKQNQFTYTWRYKKTTEETWSSWYTLDLSTAQINNNVIYQPQIYLKDSSGNNIEFEYHTSYNIEYKYADLLTSFQYSTILQPSEPVWSWGEKNVRIRDTLDFGGVDINGNTYYYGAPIATKYETATINDNNKIIAKGLTDSRGHFAYNDYENDYDTMPSGFQLDATTLTTKQNNKWILPTCWADIIYPVGSIYMNVNNTNPSLLFGGTWEQIKGKFLVGVDSSDTDFNTSGKIGGTKNHSHIYGVQYNGYYGALYSKDQRLIRLYNGETDAFVESYYTQNSSSETGNNGVQQTSGSTFDTSVYETKTPTTKTSNLPPYMTVYMWKRTT